MTQPRTRMVVLTLLASCMAVSPAIVSINAGLIYNPTPSAPRGWYVVRPIDRANVGDFVVARLPAPLASLAADRAYLPASVPLLKRVAATAGQAVCSSDGAIWIDGTLAARVHVADAAGRRMPSWSGCRVLAHDELFLLSTNSSSFDSRYFGPLPRACVVGAATPLWIWR